LWILCNNQSAQHCAYPTAVASCLARRKSAARGNALEKYKVAKPLPECPALLPNKNTSACVLVLKCRASRERNQSAHPFFSRYPQVGGYQQVVGFGGRNELMGLSLKEHNAIAGLADVLYDFLPGSGSQQWSGHITFRSVAAKVGVSNYWLGGSKRPAIVALLSHTLERDRSRFQPLIIEIVRQGIVYRQKNGNPLRIDDIDRLNGHILELGFKFPELWDPDFRASLRQDAPHRAKERVEEAIQQERLKETAREERQVRLDALREEFLRLHTSSDRSKAGLALERLLTELFSLFNLNPRKSFRVVGEQIDGSFELDHETYLLEAKWEKNPLSEHPLAYFREQIDGSLGVGRVPYGLQIFRDVSLDYLVEFVRVYQNGLNRSVFIHFSIDARQSNH
jgi:hypothetical protein